MKKHDSMETYLETIYILSRAGNPVRSIDIVNELEYSKPSVSVAMKNLRAGGHIAVGKSGHITLTESGMRIAENMFERHTLISKWLISLGVDEKIAVEDACRMEHIMSEQSFTAIKSHVERGKLLC